MARYPLTDRVLMRYNNSVAAQNVKKDCGSWLEGETVVTVHLQAEATRLTLIKRYSHLESHINVVNLA